MTIGKRIAEERKRKALSQSAFAELVGVSFSSQRRYENDERAPDTSYLQQLTLNGVDVEYVLSGRAKSLKGYGVDGMILGDFGLAVAKLNHLNPGDILAVERMAAGLAKEATKNLADDDPDGHVTAYEEAFLVATADLLNRKTANPARAIDAETIDVDLLSSVLSQVDGTLKRARITMQAEKKAQATALLYRAFKASGKIDPAMIKETVKLASG